MLNILPSHRGFPAARFLGGFFLLGLLVGCEPGAEPERSLEVAARSLASGVLSSTGESALVGSGYHGGSLWQLDERARLYNWNHTEGDYTLLTSVGLSPEGTWALTSDRDTLVLWSAETGEAAQYWSSPAEVLDMSLGPNGDFALLGLSDRRAALYNVKRGGVMRSYAHQGPVSSVSLSADGQWALTGSDDGTAVLWDTASGEALARRVYPVDVQLVRLSPGGERALSASRYEGVHIWDTDSDAVWELPLPEERLKRGLRLSAARFSSDGAYLLTGRPDGFVQLWDLEARDVMYSWQMPKRKAWQPTAAVVLDVAFTEDLNRYRALTSDGFVHDLTY